MKLPWQRRSAPAPATTPATGAAARLGALEQTSPTLRRALAAAFRKQRPEILDLGPMCGETVVFLADRGARVSVHEFDGMEPEPVPTSDGPPVAPAPLRIELEDGRFDLVLAWEHVDFVPPKRVHEFCLELHRVLAADGRLLLFSLGHGTPAGGLSRPCRFRVLTEERVVREDTAGPDRARWTHLTRDIERGMLPLATEALHLQRTQLREFLARKVPPRP